jgi:hypothetical protein
MITPDTIKSLLQHVRLVKPDNTIISPVSLIQEINTRQHNSVLKNTDECTAFFKTINNAAWISPEAKEFIFGNAMFMMTALAYYDNTDELIENLAPYMLDTRIAKQLKIPSEVLYIDVSDVLRQTHENFLGNEKLRAKILTTCRKVIQKSAEDMILDEYAIETEGVIHVSSALSSQQQIWCLLLSYIHNATEIFTYLSKMFVPARKIIYKCRDGQYIPFNVWRLLSGELPEKINGSASILNDFHTAIYSPESRHISSVYGPTRFHHNVISFKCEAPTLIRQIICMGLQNWSEIWFKSRWPRHPELVKRLILYRKSTNGRVNQELIQRMFFKFKQ